MEGMEAAARMKQMAASRSILDVYRRVVRGFGRERGGGAEFYTISGPPLPPAPARGTPRSARASDAERGRGRTCGPDDVIGFDVIEDFGSLLLVGNFVETMDACLELSRPTDGEFLNGGRLLGGADEAGDGPGLLEEEGGKQLGDFAVAADDEDVVWGGHDDCCSLQGRIQG